MKIIHGVKVPIKAWIDGVTLEDEAIKQVFNLSSLPFIYKWIALMPDVHSGVGSTIGSVIATDKAVIPAAVGVDIGCGMCAIRTTLTGNDLPDNLSTLRSKIESFIPVGFSKRSVDNLPWNISLAWSKISSRDFMPKNLFNADEPACQLATLGGGNHFIEICLDELNNVWVMIHTGSRGIGNKIGKYYIEKAKEEMRKFYINLPDIDLAYLPEGSQFFNEYIDCVNWAQSYAALNRYLMIEIIVSVLKESIKPFSINEYSINCHHNYVQKENHYNRNIFITRKGAVSARKGQLGIIPGSMGTKSYIVEGLGNQESFTSCSHGAGRIMSRTKAKSKYTIEDLIESTSGIECRKDSGVIDEIPMAYKNIDAVINAQKDLIKVVATLRQILCIKG